MSTDNTKTTKPAAIPANGTTAAPPAKTPPVEEAAAEKSGGKGKIIYRPELVAMDTIDQVFDDLDDGEKGRVLNWINAKHGPKLAEEFVKLMSGMSNTSAAISPACKHPGY